MKKVINLILNYWWIILICILTLYIILVSILNCPELTRITTTTFSYFSQIIAPLGVILGLILGYPLLKRKLIDSYITNQFEIIHENNRVLRKECLRLKEKYPVKYISQRISEEYLETVVTDLENLNRLAIDANPDSYKYSYLLFKSLKKFKEEWKIHQFENYYNETISTFIYNHLDNIYNYSKSIGFVPENSNIKVKQILNPRIGKYVIDNKYYEIDGFDQSITYKKASALLVLFYYTNIRCSSMDNGLLFKSCYKSAPSPSPFARIMHNQKIYIPLILKGESDIGVFIPTLVFVGYERIETTLLESGISTHYLVCHYANISQVGFVEGCIKSKESLSDYKDAYLAETVIRLEDLKDFKVNKESISFKISEKDAMKYYVNVKNHLCKKMDNEIF